MRRNFVCNVTDHSSSGLGLTASNEVHMSIVFILEKYSFLLTLIIWCTVGNAELQYPVKISCSVNVNELPWGLILGLPYPVRFLIS